MSITRVVGIAQCQRPFVKCCLELGENTVVRQGNSIAAEVARWTFYGPRLVGMIDSWTGSI